MPDKIRVMMAGAYGRMGRTITRGIMEDERLDMVAATDLQGVGEDIGTLVGMTKNGVTINTSLEEAILNGAPQVMVDFTNPRTVLGNARIAINNGVRPVIGTTGLTPDNIKEIDQLSRDKGIGAIIVPNFAIGAVLMMLFARQAARYLPQAEIIELHHDQKLDAPSGTAIKTAELIREVRESQRQGHPDEEEKITGARGGNFDGMRIHSVRLPGYVAHQEVIFGGLGQTLTIRHDSISRESFIPGVLMAIRHVMNLQGVIYGLEKLLAE